MFFLTKGTFSIYYLNFHCTFVELWQRQRPETEAKFQSDTTVRLTIG